MEKQVIIYDGKSWSKWKNEKYYKHANTFLHRYVWEKYNGKIEDGYHIHHLDHNPDNNDISNLIKVSPIEHATYHKWDEERLQKAREHLNNIRPSTKQWHSSKEGREWHKEHARLFCWGHLTYGRAKCEVCGMEFEKKQDFQKFCSNKCRSKARRMIGSDTIIKKCVICGKEFSSNKYDNTLTCSRSCANKVMWIKKKTTPAPEISEDKCIVCGNPINKLLGTKKFCSNKCKSKYRRQQGLDLETRICSFCGKEFKTNKYSKASMCSRACSNKNRAKK